MSLGVFAEVVKARRRLKHGTDNRLRLVTNEPDTPSIAAVRADLVQIMAVALAAIERLDK